MQNLFNELTDGSDAFDVAAKTNQSNEHLFMNELQWIHLSLHNAILWQLYHIN